MTNTKRDNFLKSAADYFENGLIYEVFTHDDFSICNVANDFYAIFFYPESTKMCISYETYGPLGIAITSDYVRKISKNLRNVAVLSKLGDDLKSSSFRLGKRIFKDIEARKKYTDLHGPSPSIDLDMEKELLNGDNRRDWLKWLKWLKWFK